MIDAHSRTTTRLSALFAALLALLLAGCGGTPRPSIEDGTYDGPPLSIDQSGRTVVLLMEAPSPGWSVTLDRAAEARDHWQAFVTVRRPNPGYMHAQVIVTQHVLTTVESRRPLRVYGRVLEFGDDETDGAYREAARAGPGSATPPAETRPADLPQPEAPPGEAGT